MCSQVDALNDVNGEWGGSLFYKQLSVTFKKKNKANIRAVTSAVGALPPNAYLKKEDGGFGCIYIIAYVDIRFNIAEPVCALPTQQQPKERCFGVCRPRTLHDRNGSGQVADLWQAAASTAKDD